VNAKELRIEIIENPHNKLCNTAIARYINKTTRSLLSKLK
jgi:hypothetical protein